MKKALCMFCGAPATLLCDGIIGWDADEDKHGHMTKCRGMFTCDAPVCRNCATWHGNIFFRWKDPDDGYTRPLPPCARSYTKPANPYALQSTGKTPPCRNPA